jgi:hypothetical protein
VVATTPLGGVEGRRERVGGNNVEVVGDTEDCRFVVSPDPTPLQLMYRSLADNKKTYVANFNKLVCPYFPICDPVIGGVIVRFDNQHISGTFAVSLAPAVTLYLQNAGLLPA